MMSSLSTNSFLEDEPQRRKSLLQEGFDADVLVAVHIIPGVCSGPVPFHVIIQRDRLRIHDAPLIHIVLDFVNSVVADFLRLFNDGAKAVHHTVLHDVRVVDQLEFRSLEF